MLGKRLALILCLMIIFISLLNGCSDVPSANRSPIQKEAGDNPKKPEDTEDQTKKTIVPISISEGEFGGIQGWLSDQTIVYLTNTDRTSILYLYDIYSGKTTNLFVSDIPIVSAQISPSRERLLVHTSPNSYEGIVNVLDKKGNVLVNKTIISSEMTFEWNPFNEDLILVSTFSEEWEFNVSILNIAKDELKDSVLTKQPFASWLTGDEFIYQDWDVSTPSFYAPLVKQGINNEEGEQLDFNNVFQFDSFKDTFLIISTNDNEQDNAVYSLVSNKFEILKTFTIPQLTKYSDWLVPYHDFSQKNKQFITFQPVSSGESDTYNQGFKLVQYDLYHKKEEVLLEGLENKPVKFSPNGDFLLYGYQFENIIDVQTKKIISLIKE